MKGKVLVLMTAAPPYAPGEEFLNNEYLVHEEVFEKILVIHHSAERKSDPPPSPKFELAYFPYLPDLKDKIASLYFLFSPIFWREIGQLIFRYQLFPTRRRIALLLGALIVGRKTSLFISGKIAGVAAKDVVVYSYWCNFTAVAGAMLKRKSPSLSVVTRAHGYDLFFERSAVRYQPLRDFIYSTLNAVYFISESGAQYAIRKNGQRPCFQVSYLGCPEVALHRTAGVRNDFQLVSCSAAIPLKRIHLIIEALSLHADSSHPVHWTHFGDGPLLNPLKELAHRLLGQLPHIQYEFPGYVSNNALLEYYGKMNVDLFICVSESEGLPFSMMEAFAAAIPVMTTHVGAVDELVIDGTNGILLESNPPPAAIYERLNSFIHLEDQVRQSFQKEAKATWVSKFNAKQNYRKFVSDLVSSKSS